MRKKLSLLLLLLLIPTLAYAWGVMIVGGGVPTGVADCSGCNTGNDSLIVDPGYTTSAQSSDVSYVSMKFTIGTEQCATGVMIECTDDTTETDAYGYIYSDNAGEPGSLVSGCSGYVANLPDTATETEFTFASTVTLSAGTYHVVWYDNGQATSDYRYGASGAPADVFHFSSDGSSWSDSSYYKNFGVWGCEPS